MTDTTNHYPVDMMEWRDWIKKNLGYTTEQGIEFVRAGTFPVSELVAVWRQEFTVEKGYVADFIPALERNKMGFLRWIYADGAEPFWKESD
ncbi:MAG: hypothetical protein ACFFE2_04320 [Candidatus Thorarchaeota archaeon]